MRSSHLRMIGWLIDREDLGLVMNVAISTFISVIIASQENKML